MFIEEDELMCEVNQSRKKRQSNDVECSRIATSTGRLTTEIGLSEMEETIKRGPPKSRVNVPWFGEHFWVLKCLHVEDCLGMQTFVAVASNTLVNRIGHC